MSESVSTHVSVTASAATTPGPSRFSRILAAALAMPITLYRTWISPMSGPTCRFYPSCSQYALTALSVHGAGKGTLLATARLCRCHPWTPGGVDQVPPVGRWRPDLYVRDADRPVIEEPADMTPVNEVRSAE